MLDFIEVSRRRNKNGTIEIYPRYLTYKLNNEKITDLMIKGGDFYAVWDESKHLWSTDEDVVKKLIDKEMDEYVEKNKDKFDSKYTISYLRYSDTGEINRFHNYCQSQLRDLFHELDEKLTFSNTETTKEDYASKRLNYPLAEGDIVSYDKMMSVLYSSKERHKIEWVIGAIVAGESKNIQKFLVLYGPPGTGKSTALDIILLLFKGYCAPFVAKDVVDSNKSFSLEPFKDNPLVGFEQDGDLSKINDNTKLNSLVSHELMSINAKHKSLYSQKFNTFLIIATNKIVNITDAKSGLLRRLIYAEPTGNLIPYDEYIRLKKNIKYELGGIANHCLNIFLEDPHYYDNYIPNEMMALSNDFYNFVLDYYYDFKAKDYTTLIEAWEKYNKYCVDARVLYPMTRKAFSAELKNYFENFEERKTLEDGTRVRSYYSIFKPKLFAVEQKKEVKKNEEKNWLILKEQKSIFDELCKDCVAQYANNDGVPKYKWDNVKTKLSELDTSLLHYVLVPIWHIVIDFDIPDENGNKSLEKNLEAANKWPETYAELSKSGCGIHLHYIYQGDPSLLDNKIDDHIELKVYCGKSALRRKLTKCNDIPIKSISSGLPFKKEKSMVEEKQIKSEKGLRNLILKIMRKECCPGTKPSIDFLVKILDDAYANENFAYDVSNMEHDIMIFASNSTHHAEYCLSKIDEMHFKSKSFENGYIPKKVNDDDDSDIVFFDCEVFPNLFLVNWKGRGVCCPINRMINPSPDEIKTLITSFKLVGFNCRKYDNHILYARYMGYTNEMLYKLSCSIVSGDKHAMFGNAYNISYTDIYDFAATKQSLKKWEIELGIHHLELNLPWDQPVDESLWETVSAYCDNDVLATEALFDHLHGDWTARKILADLANGTVNDTTNALTTKIIFEGDKHPILVYTDLATGKRSDGSKSKYNNSFPGYKHELITEISKTGKEKKAWHNTYRGEDAGFGGYVFSVPGIYGNVALLDIASMHPHSEMAMGCFGEYQHNFDDLVNARIYIKRKDFDRASKLFGGKLKKYLNNPDEAKQLAQALKIAINSVYGLTAASFDNPFRDPRNVNNIVALRGALFMINLKHEILDRGFKVCHIKTDSIKIPDATPEIISFCMDYANEYGYTFEHEATYERMCLINDADYIAKTDKGIWTATGARFKEPYVFKTLFTHDDITFRDLCQAMSVSSGSALYIDANEDLPEGEHNYKFVGRVGNFCPVLPGSGGGRLLRFKDDKYYNATGTTGYLWLEAEEIIEKDLMDKIDYSYFDKMVSEAEKLIISYGDKQWFLSDEPYVPPKYEDGKPVYEDDIF